MTATSATAKIPGKRKAKLITMEHLQTLVYKNIEKVELIQGEIDKSGGNKEAERKLSKQVCGYESRVAEYDDKVLERALVDKKPDGVFKRA